MVKMVPKIRKFYMKMAQFKVISEFFTLWRISHGAANFLFLTVATDWQSMLREETAHLISMSLKHKTK